MIDYKKTGLKILGIISIVLIVFLAIGVGIFFWPFLIAIITAIILEKLVEYIVKKNKNI